MVDHSQGIIPNWRSVQYISFGSCFRVSTFIYLFKMTLEQHRFGEGKALHDDDTAAPTLRPPPWPPTKTTLFRVRPARRSGGDGRWSQGRAAVTAVAHGGRQQSRQPTPWAQRTEAATGKSVWGRHGWPSLGAQYAGSAAHKSRRDGYPRQYRDPNWFQYMSMTSIHVNTDHNITKTRRQQVIRDLTCLEVVHAYTTAAVKLTFCRGSSSEYSGSNKKPWYASIQQ